MNIVITGASRGIGFHTALNLVKNTDHKIFALSRDERGLKKLSDTFGSEQIVTMPFDITDALSIKEVVEKMAGMVSGVEVLINNAGYLLNKSFMELTAGDWQAVYNVNVFGVVNFTRALIPLLLKGIISPTSNIKAHIVNISSMGGIQGSVKFNGLSAYSSSKAALIGISECLSEELKTSGVRVNCIALGSVETEMFLTAFPEFKASVNPEEISIWLADFALRGYNYFNGKILPVSTSNP